MRRGGGFTLRRPPAACRSPPAPSHHFPAPHPREARRVCSCTCNSFRLRKRCRRSARVRAIACRIVELEAAEFSHPTWYKNSARSQKNSRATRTSTFADFNPAASQSRLRMEGDARVSRPTHHGHAGKVCEVVNSLYIELLSRAKTQDRGGQTKFLLCPIPCKKCIYLAAGHMSKLGVLGGLLHI
jgi:hypothetical protein